MAARPIKPAKAALNGANLRAAAASGVSARLILWLLDPKMPLDQGDRVLLAMLLAGELHTTGRPGTKGPKTREFNELLRDVEVEQLKLRKAGKSAYQALDAAAKWAARDPRARNNSWKTIKRKMQARKGL